MQNQLSRMITAEIEATNGANEGKFDGEFSIKTKFIFSIPSKSAAIIGMVVRKYPQFVNVPNVPLLVSMRVMPDNVKE